MLIRELLEKKELAKKGYLKNKEIRKLNERDELLLTYRKCIEKALEDGMKLLESLIDYQIKNNDFESPTVVDTTAGLIEGISDLHDRELGLILKEVFESKFPEDSKLVRVLLGHSMGNPDSLSLRLKVTEDEKERA